MSLSFLFFLVAGGAIAAIDAKKEIVPDRLILPSIVILGVLRYFEGHLFESLVAAVGVAIFFAILLYFFDDFGGGDIRFGAFCALLLGYLDIFVFFIIAGVLHLLSLWLLSKKTFGFAPAMYVAAVCAKLLSGVIWKLA